MLIVSATQRGFLTGPSVGDGQDQQADCTRRHAGSSLARDSQADGETGGRDRRRRRGQEGSGRVRSLARAELNWFCQGQPWGRCRVRRRALRVMRPAREKKRRRRVLVVTTGSPRPMARGPTCQVVGHDLHGQPGGVGGEASRGEVVEPHAVLEIADGGSRSRRGGGGRPRGPACSPLGR